MNFRSDNVVGAAPEILEALVAGNAGAVASYGGDPVTARVGERLAEVFGCPLDAFPVASGTAANSLALSAAVPPYGSIYCHAESHIANDECGGPELMTGGARLLPLAGAHGRLDPGDLDRALARGGRGDVHHVQPAALSLAQLTEAGTIYAPGHVAALAEVAHRHGLVVHMDGARLANAVAALGCAPAEVTWRAGVDMLSFGATKNGCLAAEAVVFFRRDLAEGFAFRRKRAGHLLSKMRFVSLQLDAYLRDGLWLGLAARANAMGRRLADGLAHVPGARFVHEPEANELFVDLPLPVVEGLEAAGFEFYRWEGTTCRLVTSFATTEAAVDTFIEAALALGGGASRSA